MADAALVLCSCPVAGQAAPPLTVFGPLQPVEVSRRCSKPFAFSGFVPCYPFPSGLSFRSSAISRLFPAPEPRTPRKWLSLFSRPTLPTFRRELGIITGWRPGQVLAQGTPLTPGSLASALQRLPAACTPQRHVRVPLSKSLVVLRASTSTRPYHPAQQAQVPLRSLFQGGGPQF